ncbi:Murein polymerase [Piscirickettsia salmonis]|uniref:Penicillin-binding protein 1B n=1 Tax=Piscirickettsia salmonis TaxID=1238 RepID=A0A1L6TF00_PISSA|nr:penicillin-binding protein 1B [Piscirickettsia salmonis]AKP72461.2 hypothetical protein PSLF89_287 [Piscirickettsia salmonis LF-89 = ATCC VR-1361]ALB24078.1 penicillin-binding protein 1B [Piscirickettsia salmonis]AMA43451.1 hypothetical protein AWJ11_14515 [Piscirickettsia salmonis]AOS35920.1 hypothetical protein AVM72_11630 [Piscirickettsia salmonis]APS60624.1 hypothetical protein AVI53_08610 [Piscirickettsia salmonis]
MFFLKPRFWLSLILRLSLVFIIFVVAFVFYCNYIVTHQFDIKTAQIPAQVYAAPLELFKGATLKKEQLIYTLSRLGYHRTTKPSVPGNYIEDAGRFTIYVRTFDFWDGLRQATKIELAIENGQVSELNDAQTQKPLALFRLDPQLIGGIYPTKKGARVFVPINKMPVFLKQALLASEDRSFYQNWGISFRGIVRALVTDVLAGGYVQGGSTITQQLVKNLFLTQKKTLSRKLQGLAMAMLLTFHYSKDEILQAYMNEVYLGQNGNHGVHGFGLASLFYFGRPVSSLTLPEAATLVGIIPAPSYFNPQRHPQRALKRRNLVLQLMYQQGVISKVQLQRAQAAPLGVTMQSQWGSEAYPAFMDLVERQLQQDYSHKELVQDGLRVFTTLNPWVQTTANQVIEKRLNNLEAQYSLEQGKLEAASVIVDPVSAQVLAIVGGRDAHYDGYNRALDAKRPIGSITKPAIYLTALEQPEQYNLATPVEDAPIYIQGPDGKVWSPKNSSLISHGKVPLMTALAHSYNEASVRLGMQVGLANVLNTIRHMGIKAPIQAYPANLLGAYSLSPFQVATMYETIASGGFSMPLRAITAVTDMDGKVLGSYAINVKEQFNPAGIYLLTRAMQQVGDTGTGRLLYQILPKELNFAGKTGSSQNLRDGWFAGFTGNLLTVVWVGRDDYASSGLYGQQGAGHLWAWLMKDLHATPLNPVMPEDIEFAWANKHTGLLSEQGCEDAVYVPFMKNYGPKFVSRCGIGDNDDGSSTVTAAGALENKGLWHWLKGLFGSQ